MDRKGSITVFLTLVLSLMLSLVCTSIESVRMAAARTQILSSLDIGLYSLFGQYDKTLLKDYDLFLLDGSWGGGMLDMAKVYDNMESYIKPVLRQNSQKLSLVEGGFTGCRLATDEEGEAFYCQVVQYMKDTLGSQGIQLLTERMRERENKTKEAEETGKQAQSKDAIGSYEREMNEAAKNSQQAQEAADAAAQEGNGQSLGHAGLGHLPRGVDLYRRGHVPVAVQVQERAFGERELVHAPDLFCLFINGPNTFHSSRN